MLDITKCDGKGCEKRVNCYRFTSKPERLQSYSAFYELMKDDECEYYWEDKNGSKRNNTRITEVI